MSGDDRRTLAKPRGDENHENEEDEMNWHGKRVLVTGGCSFIGSHLVDALVARGPAHLRVVDDLSTGRLANIGGHVDEAIVEFRQGDLRDPVLCAEAARGMDVVFHLAAIHGGRGYIDLHQADCTANLVLDGNVVRAAVEAGVERLVFASSGCVYPVGLQTDPSRPLWLEEPMVGPPYDPDGTYGWAKLSTELTLAALYRDHGFSSSSCRLFTVYGERCLESHAVIAMIGRAFLGQRPFEVWGDGTQVRNWTYVGDIVRGLVLAAERVSDGSAVNLGTEEPIRVIDAARMVLGLASLEAPIRLRPDMPTGPLSRVASNARARELLGWTPEVAFAEGLARTLDWYFASRRADRDRLAERFETLVLER